MYRIGIDVGGTFTDLVLSDEQGNLYITKVPSTPEDQSVGFVQALEKAARELGLPFREFLEQTSYIGHGSTVATNACVERKGARVGLLTTKGFRDILYIRRQERKFIYDLFQEISIPLVPRNLTLEVDERVDRYGKVRVEMIGEEARLLVRKLKELGVEAIAVSLLFSFANPIHERQLKAIIEEEFPAAFTTVSSELMPIVKEYERTSTIVINAYVGPIMKRYLQNLTAGLQERGFAFAPVMMTSNGGVISVQEAIKSPVLCLASGPAGGVMSSLAVGESIGDDNLITFDMGGTSTDVSLIHRGRPDMAPMRKYDFGHGDTHPVCVPLIDIHVVGAGGGSVAWVDEAGALKVGPHSQGAKPGPACYALGGAEPCVTDANLVLGYLNPDYYCGGEIKLDIERSREAIVGKVGARLNMGLVTAAQGIHRLVNTNMVNAIRVISTERGYDPREYTMVVYGAAGPQHAARMLEELRMTKAIVPCTSGGLSAHGLLSTDVVHHFTRTYLAEFSKVDLAVLGSIFTQMEEEGMRRLVSEGVGASVEINRFLDVRYLGQVHEVTTRAPSGEMSESWLAQVRATFDREHDRLYGHSHVGDPVELVNVRVVVVGKIPRGELKRHEIGGVDASPALKGKRDVFWEEMAGFAETPVYERDGLKAGNGLQGPAIIEAPLTTIVVPPGFRVEIDEYLNTILLKGEARE
ncbi:MAG: hydantoinase/oxoprolinase family protein [Chloroflexi bacterium]|nr:hydantoinase/oxoprolinase family protein [Chloroflexota bacterium]